MNMFANMTDRYFIASIGIIFVFGIIVGWLLCLEINMPFMV